MPKSLMSASDIADKLISRGNSAGEAYRKGIQSVQTAPGQLAAQKKQKYLDGVNRNVDKWAANVAAVSLADWANAAINKGAANLGSGLTHARPKIIAFWNQFGPFLSNAMSTVQSMPTDTYEQRKARADRMMDLLHQFRMSH